MDHLKELLLKLDGNGCRFVLAGGFGAVSWGSSLVTRDVAVACDLSVENLLRVWAALKDLHPCHRMTPDRQPFTCEQALQGNWRNLYLATEIGQLDLLGEIEGIGDYAACLAQSELIPICGREVRVLTLDALIVNVLFRVGRDRTVIGRQ